jgi:hypothetical protein
MEVDTPQLANKSEISGSDFTSKIEPTPKKPISGNKRDLY